jgi:phosphoribosylformimino-5-aminoimidazole carboxamide ribotide isomerase
VPRVRGQTTLDAVSLSARRGRHETPRVVILPALDLAGGEVVSAREGVHALGTRGDDPLDVARTLVAAGARGLHVVDLDGARTGEYRNLALVAAIARAAGVPVQLGGSVTDIGVARDALANGIARVVFGSAALGDPDRLPAIARLGAAALLALEVEADRLRPRGGDVMLAESVQGADALELARLAAERGVSRFYVVDVEADGRLGGPPLAFIARLHALLGDAIAELYVGGGVRDLIDVRDLAAVGVRGVVVGRALQESRFTIADAQRVADEA